MARHESDFRADADQPLELAELLALLGDSPEGGEQSREKAIACYLSGSEGWRDALKSLRGTFAGGATKLRDGNSD